MSEESRARAAQRVVSAWTVPGPNERYHWIVQGEVRAKWPVLAAAIDELVRESA